MTDDEMRMSFTEHLGELRDRLIRSGIAVVIGVAICYTFSNQIIAALARPIKILEKEISGVVITPDDELGLGGEDGAPGADSAPDAAKPGQPATGAGATPGKAEDAKPDEKGAMWLTLRPEEPYLVRLKIGDGGIERVKVVPDKSRGGGVLEASWTVLNPLEPIIVKFKVAGYGGLFLAMPFILFQLCAFVFPGLQPREKKAAQYLIFGCTVLAFAGVALAYFGVFPFVLPYLAQFVPEGMNVQLRMNETISMIAVGLLGFGIAFQFPMVVLILVYLGILDPALLRQYRKIVVVFLAIGSALLTPPDPITMMFMLVPLCLLYESSIWMSYLVIRRTRPAADTHKESKK